MKSGYTVDDLMKFNSAAIEARIARLAMSKAKAAPKAKAKAARKAAAVRKAKAKANAKA